MGEFVYSVDCFYWPIVLDTNSATLVVSEDGGARENVTLGTGYYWAYNATAAKETAIGLDSLWREVTSQLNSHGALNNVYEVNAAEPTSATSMAAGTVELARTGTGANVPFTLHFQDPDFSFPDGGSPSENAGRLFGFGKQASDQASAAGSIRGDFSMWGVWQSRTMDESGAATRKVPDPRRNVKVSVDDKTRARAQQYNKTTLREFTYQAVPGGVVYRDRARDAGSADTARLAEGDLNNAVQDLYAYGARPGKNARMSRVLVVHDEGDQGLDAPDHKWEVFRLWEEEDITTFRAWLREQKTAGELYEVKFKTQIVNGAYRQ